ncbi:MAG: formate hydrogenlyase [Candidatus Micrarchaeota archaeon]|nr:formate hydrogenlyase [Candidatus Micrarchaeota archaeon]
MNEFDALLKYPKTDRISKDSKSKVIREIAELLEKRPLSPFSRSISVRMIDCGSSNDVEIEEGLANSPQVDCERFGIHFVASPRHADVLLVSGPVSINMKRALEKTYAAMPHPKAVVAVGDGAVTDRIFSKSNVIYKSGKVEDVVPVTIKVPGNPPAPYELVLGILKAGIILSRQ